MMLIVLPACTLNSLDGLPTLPPTLGATAESPLPIPATPPPLIVESGGETADGWQILAAGIEQRTFEVDGSFAELTALRFDPTMVTFRAHYRPQEPLTLRQWQTELTGAVAIINTNFYTAENYVLGLLIADGLVYGQSYTDRGGWFGVQNGGAFVRSNINAPYQGEAIEQAVQAFPMLVVDGQQAYTSTAPDRVTRRTAIAQDTQGRIVFLITSQGGMTLVALSAYLANADMDLANAFNLDGGGSTMLYSGAGGGSPVSFASFDPVPAVLAVYPQ